LDTALTESVEGGTRDTRRRALPRGMGGGRRGSLAPIGRETLHQRLLTNDITYAFNQIHSQLVGANMPERTSSHA
jgi:hypothetical protein